MKVYEREPLLADLRHELATSRSRPGRLVLIAGEAGIDKTTLVEAFRADVDGGRQVLWGACDAAVPPRPFGAADRHRRDHRRPTQRRARRCRP